MALGATIASLTGADLIAAAGTISYDGVAFNALRNYTFRCKPIYDEADWTVTHLRYTLRLHGWIMAADVATQETAMASLQTRLTRPGRTLILSGLGLDTSINTGAASSQWPDMIWGAKPRLLDMKPAGGLIAWEFDWEIEFNINRDASTVSYGLGHLAAFNYTAAYSIDEEGLTTRTLEGYLEVSNRRQANGSRLVPSGELLELAWTRTNITLPVGFRRVNISRRISADRHRLNFIVVDQELTGDAFPQGIVNAKVEHEFSNEPPGFIRWQSTLSGSLTVAKGYPKALAAQKFFLILQDVAIKARVVAHASQISGTVIPVRLKFSTQKFGRTSRFFVAFTMAACLEDILAKSGIWSPVPNTNWQQWASSMRDVGIGTNHGVARLFHRLGDDKIIDLAAAQAVVSIGNDGVLERKRKSSYSNDPLCPEPTKRHSWMHYANRIQSVEQANTVVHRAAQPAEPMRLQTASSQIAEQIGIMLGHGGSASEKPHTVQHTASTDQLFLMYGDAVRMKWAPLIPELLKIGGVPVELLAQSIDIGPVAAYFDCPMFTARWTKLYRVKGYAPTMTDPANQFLCMKKGANDGSTSGTK